MKRSFFQAAVTSILLYGCTTWTLTKRLEKKLDGNYTRMLRAILNKSWQQHPTRHQLYGHLPPITKSIQVRRTRHAGHCWRSRDELIRDVLLWIPTHTAAQKQDDQHERTFSSYVRIQVVVLKTYLGRWTIGRSGERGSGISVLPARYDDDDDDIAYSGGSLRPWRWLVSLATWLFVDGRFVDECYVENRFGRKDFTLKEHFVVAIFFYPFVPSQRGLLITPSASFQRGKTPT